MGGIADEIAPSDTASPSFTCHQDEGLLTVTVEGTVVVQDAPSSSILAVAVTVVSGGDGNTPVKSIIEDAPITVPDPGAQGPVPNAQMVATEVLPIVNSYWSMVPPTGGGPLTETTVFNPASTSYEGLLKVIVQEAAGVQRGLGTHCSSKLQPAGAQVCVCLIWSEGQLPPQATSTQPVHEQVGQAESTTHLDSLEHPAGLQVRVWLLWPYGQVVPSPQAPFVHTLSHEHPPPVQELSVTHLEVDAQPAGLTVLVSNLSSDAHGDPQEPLDHAP